MMKTQSTQAFKGIFDYINTMKFFVLCYSFQQRIAYVTSIVFILWNDQIFYTSKKKIFKVSEIFWLFDRDSSFSTRVMLSLFIPLF